MILTTLELDFEENDYLRVVYSLRYRQSKFKHNTTMRKRVSSRKLPWVLLLVHSQKQNLYFEASKIAGPNSLATLSIN